MDERRGDRMRYLSVVFFSKKLSSSSGVKVDEDNLMELFFRLENHAEAIVKMIEAGAEEDPLH